MDDLKGAPQPWSAREAHYSVREVEGPGDLARARGLRQLCFRGREGIDADPLDEACRHVLVEDARGRLAATFRMMTVTGGTLGETYSSARYDLTPLSDAPWPMIELGRFCLRPGPPDPDLVRIAWGALTGRVLASGAGMLFGCSSFPGTDPARYADAFALLGQRHLGPARLRPRPDAAETHAFPESEPDLWAALRQMPPLLRAYLGMGGWTSDHAVIDRDLGTLHVFTALEVSRIPPARAAKLRALAGV